MPGWRRGKKAVSMAKNKLQLPQQTAFDLLYQNTQPGYAGPACFSWPGSVTQSFRTQAPGRNPNVAAPWSLLCAFRSPSLPYGYTRVHRNYSAISLQRSLRGAQQRSNPLDGGPQTTDGVCCAVASLAMSLSLSLRGAQRRSDLRAGL